MRTAFFSGEGAKFTEKSRPRTVSPWVKSASMLEGAERLIYALRQGRNVGGLVPVSTVVQSVYANLNEMAGGGKKIPGLPTGLADLDRSILGLNNGELIIIAARPGMAATNRADILDNALLRPGRFDREVYVGLPDIRGREAILKVHARGKPLGEDVNLNSIAKGTPGFSGADLENLLNEAAILAVRRGHRFIVQMDIDESIMVDMDAVNAFRARALNPEHPVMRGSHENGDIFFQNKEASNKYYEAVPGIVEDYMGRINAKLGTDYQLFNYYGAPDADRVIVAMFGTALASAVTFVDFVCAKSEKLAARRPALLGVYGALMFAGSLAGFGGLIGTVYPVFGYASSVFVVLLILHGLRFRKQRKNAESGVIS